MATPVITKAVEPTVKELGERAWSMWMESGEAEGAKSPAGKEIISRLGKIFYDSKQEAMTLSKGFLHDFLPTDTEAIRVSKAEHNAKTLRDSHSIATQLNVDYHFGPNKTQLSQLVKLASKQRNPIHGQNLADIASMALKEETPKSFKDPITKGLTDWRRQAGVQTKSPYLSSRDEQDFERRVKSTMGLLYLGRVAIPHTMQHLNSLLTEGVSAYSKSMFDMTQQASKKEAIEFATKSGALFDETLRDMQTIAQGKDTLWHKIFYMPGFSQVRKWEIIQAANSGRYAVTAAAKRFAEDPTDKVAEAQLRWHNLDPEQILERRGKLTEDETLRAGYKAAEENLFIDRALKVPHTWDQNMYTRFATLYKGFAFREGKLIKDTIVRNFKASPVEGMKTLATLATAFPIAGEILMSMEQLATGHDPLSRANRAHWFGNANDIHEMLDDPSLANLGDEYINAMASVAAFGMNYQIFRSALRNGLQSYILGPVFGAVADIAQGSIQVARGHPKGLIKQGLRRVPVVGPAIESHYEDAVDYVEDLLD